MTAPHLIGLDFSAHPFRYAGISNAVAKAPSLVDLKELLALNEGWLHASPDDRRALRRMVEMRIAKLTSDHST